MSAVTGRLMIVALLSSVAGLAEAAPPQVTGKYAFISMTQCEAKLTVTKDAQGKVTSVNLANAGMFSSTTGYITFTPTSATEGNAVITGSTIVEGGALRVGANGFNWSAGPDNSPSAPYSFTSTTFTYNGQLYKMVYADASGGGFYRSVYLMRRSTEAGTPNCVETIWATKQPDDV